MLLKIYKIFSYILILFVPLYLNNRIKLKKEIKERINERYGNAVIKRKKGKLIWIHTASIGESLAVIPVINELEKNNRIDQILVTTGTVTSAKILENRLKGKAFHQFIPLDIPIYVERFLDHWKPVLAVFVESEIWPNFIAGIKNRKTRLMILNGRMTIKSFNNWSKFKLLSSKIFSEFDYCCAQNSDSAFFYEKLGIRDTICTGNLKFSVKPEKIDNNKLSDIKKLIGKRKIFLGASTHSGEEDIIANVTSKIRKEHEDLLSVIVPRHPNRNKFFTKNKKIKYALRSKSEEIKSKTDVYIADTVGELNLFYKIADFVFIGGSLVGHGGQNPIESAFVGKKILHGPNIQNFVDVYEILHHMKMTHLINNERQLEIYLEEHYNNPEKISEASSLKKINAEGTQALQKSMEVINQFLD